MCSDLERLLRNILNLFVKQEVIDKCSTPIQLKEIDIHKKTIYLMEKKHQTGLCGLIKTCCFRKERYDNQH